MTTARVPRRRIFAALAVCLSLGIAGVVLPEAGADQLSDKWAEAAQIAAKLSALDSRAMELNAQYERVNFELMQAEAKVTEAQVWAAQTAKELDERRQDVKDYAIAAYQMGNDSPEFDALITSDANTGVEKRSYLENLSGSRQDVVDALNSAKLKAAEDTKRLEAAQSEAAARAAEIEQTRTAANNAAAEQRALNARAQGELASLVAAETSSRNAAAAQQRAAANAARGSDGGSVGGVANPPAPGSGAAGAIAAGRTKIGSSYLWGASGPNVFDCSGFVLWAYAQVGISLPHYSGAQYKSTVRISASQLQPGDLVFWGSGGSEHVAIYIGGDQILHTANGVSITNLNGWWKGPSGYGRIST
ncbi:Spr Cell wall-associated hydrolases (invasion-associated proteins) [Acidimicrobiia bacterium]